ncbi:MAG: hypothetical protein PHZ02_17395 [Desulfocapsaceae bacterium]|nr:hypothetical protein [Desulfocapsaceae bacterium]
MKKTFILSFGILAVLNAEGLNTGTMVDSASYPSYDRCRDLAAITKNKPKLLDTYTQALPETGTAAYTVKGPVDVDVKTGNATYRIYNSINNDIADKPTYYNPLCTEVDPAYLKQEIDRETQTIKAEVEQMYSSADAIYDQAQKDSSQKSDGKTDSDVYTQALSGNVDEAKAAEEKVSKYDGAAASNKMTSPQLGFMARVNSVNNELQTLIFLVSVLLSMIALGAGYLSKKVQKRADHEDYVARFGLGVILWFLLFAPANTYKYDNGEISQTRMQSIWSWVLNKGTGAANQLAGAAHHQQMRYAISKSGGVDIEKKITGAVKEKADLDNKEGAYEYVLSQCLQTYKINDLAMAIGDAKGGGKRYFPTQESMVKMGDEDVYSRYLLPSIDPDSVYMSLSTCGIAEEEYRALVAKKRDLQGRIDAAKETKFQERYTSSAKQLVQDSTKAGWTSVAMLPVHHFAAKGVGQNIESQLNKKTFEDKKKDEDEDCSKIEMSFSDPFSKIGCYLEKLSDYTIPMQLYEKVSTFSMDNFMQSTAQRASLLIVPGTWPVFEYIKELISGIPIPGSGLFGSIIAFYTATELGLSVIENLPFLVLIPSISIVIALYYAEVFFYSITIPYVAAYAFSRDQWGHLVKHAVRGIMIALKPAMIVISVYTAIYVSDIVTSMSKDMINKQTAILLEKNDKAHQSVGFMEAIKNSVNLINDTAATGPNIYENGQLAFGGFMGKFTVYVIQGFLFLIMAVVQVYIVIKIIVSGPVMIMEMFGVRETDMASQMTESVSASAKRYEGGI